MDHLKLMIVEDDPHWLKLLTQMLNEEPEFLVVGTADHYEEAIRLYDQLKPDIVLIDVILGNDQNGGIKTAAELGARSAPPDIIMLTSMTDAHIVTESFAAGAVQYIAKKNYKELPGTIRSLHRDFSPLSLLLDDYRRLRVEEQLKELTPSERHIFELVEQGMSMSQIEQQLFKSHSTVKNQMNKILKKLGVSSRKEAIAKIKRKGVYKV
ncbi:response regulator transcription factor [Paenibacillus xylaniclasticus]|uniref:response regulator transcription factor n=1 Tax=Paenibacillus xylaniclasticus TaxID=588083 RepID=UPI000FD83172|nr:MULTISPECIES: response regulator transcription factor [Paenibacillus]GFN29935.1 DNA-binding response regulator [Paenibacillus curdlanolyticus]